jgi:hypothetical protein
LTSKDLAKAWRTWVGEVQEWNQLRNWSAKLRRDNHLNSWEWAERCFQAWKGFHAKAKYLATKAELDVERPRRIELEVGLGREQADHLRSRKKAACRAVRRMQTGDLGSYFQKWAETAFYFRFNQVRVKNMILSHYIGKLKTAFILWRKKVYHDSLQELSGHNTAKH